LFGTAVCHVKELMVYLFNTNIEMRKWIDKKDSMIAPCIDALVSRLQEYVASLNWMIVVIFCDFQFE